MSSLHRNINILDEKAKMLWFSVFCEQYIHTRNRFHSKTYGIQGEFELSMTLVRHSALTSLEVVVRAQKNLPEAGANHNLGSI